MQHLNPPHGGRLVDLMAGEDRAAEIRAQSRDWPSVDLDARQLCDLELLLNGAYSPLDGYMGAEDHASVCETMRRTDGTLWPLPITLNVSAEVAVSLTPGTRLALRDREGVMLAVMTVQEIFQPDRAAEARALFDSEDESRHEVRQHFHRFGDWAVAGPLEGVQLPVHYDYRELRLTPLELRRRFAKLGWRQVVACQTHRVIHRAQQALTIAAAREAGANLLLHPIVGLNEPGDADHYTRVRCYQALMPHYPKFLARLNLLPMASRGAGPREAVLQALVHKNYGCTHLLVDTAENGAVLDTVGAPAYDPHAAAELMQSLADEVGMAWIPYDEPLYVEDRKQYLPAGEAPEHARVLSLGADEVRRRLDDGREIPDWYTYASVARELQRTHPVRSRQGFTVFFTGLSGSGKSTVANALRVRLLEIGGRGVTLLDGDLVRRNLSSELGFSKQHRDLNIRRIGFVASEITRAGGVAICAPIAPYNVVRREVREMVTPCGGFVLVHVATPLDICESRDRKGMYAKARAGIVKEFTGISDPYEAPEDADVVIDTSNMTPAEATREILLFLERQGYLSAPDGA